MKILEHHNVAEVGEEHSANSPIRRGLTHHIVPNSIPQGLMRSELTYVTSE